MQKETEHYQMSNPAVRVSNFRLLSTSIPLAVEPRVLPSPPNVLKADMSSVAMTLVPILCYNLHLKMCGTRQSLTICLLMGDLKASNGRDGHTV